METKKKSPGKKQPSKPKADSLEDRLLVLRDENHLLKNRKIELEEEVRQ